MKEFLFIRIILRMAPKKQRKILLIGLGVTGLASFIYLICRWSSTSCEDHDTQSDFDVERYMGLWYEYARSDNVPFESGSCITA